MRASSSSAGDYLGRDDAECNFYRGSENGIADQWYIKRKGLFADYRTLLRFIRCMALASMRSWRFVPKGLHLLM
jgi:hypothetical protein